MQTSAGLQRGEVTLGEAAVLAVLVDDDRETVPHRVRLHLPRGSRRGGAHLLELGVSDRSKDGAQLLPSVGVGSDDFGVRGSRTQLDAKRSRRRFTRIVRGG